MRTRKKKWAANELENNPLVIREEGLYTGTGPIHLEVGCGKGRFIIETARRNPDTQYIALERDPMIVAFAARMALKKFAFNENIINEAQFESNAPIKFNDADFAHIHPNDYIKLDDDVLKDLIKQVNVKFMVADVDNLTDIFKPGDVSRLYINFCDPWPKKRTAKRRLTYDKYLDMYQSLSIPEIHFKTDNRILFESSLECFSRCRWIISNVSLDLHHSDMPENIMTEYEEKFSPHGPIYRLEAAIPK